jgi:hypothetical protein
MFGLPWKDKLLAYQTIFVYTYIVDIHATRRMMSPGSSRIEIHRSTFIQVADPQ